MSGGGVGRSWRTYAKHELMRNFVGQEVGVIQRSRHHRDVTRSVWYDLTSGDGVAADDSKWIHGCSPGILTYHATNSRVPVAIVLSEIQPATFDRLLSSLAENLPALGYQEKNPDHWFGRTKANASVEVIAFNQSGKHADINPLRPADAVLVLNDPNAITDWAMRPTFTREIADRTWLCRSLSTMGCNPAGIKRAPRSEREPWFDLVRCQQEALAPYRDLYLAAIERDAAQWAYLFEQADKWRDETEKVVQGAFNRVGKAAASSWFRTTPAAFEALKKDLFLTRSERDAEGGGLW